MQAVRQTQGVDNSASNLIIQKEEKLQRTRDLKTIQLYRQLLIIELNVDTRFEVNIDV